MRAWFMLLLLSSLVSAGAQDYFTSPEQGFRIQTPGPPWTLVERSPAPDTRYTVEFVRAGGLGHTAVTVYVADLPTPLDSEQACDGAEARARGNPLVSELERGRGTLAGEPAPWLRFTYQADLPYTVRILYRVHGDALYALQGAAPAAAYAEVEAELAGFIAGFELLASSDEGARKDGELLARLAARCGSELDFARDWAEASARAAEQSKTVWVVVERYRGIVLEPYAHSTMFMDSDIVALVRERFVPLHLTEASGAPFEDPARYGLGPSTFGQGLLFTDAAGDVLELGASLDPFHAYEVARELLREHPGAPARDGGDVAELLRRGDLPQAEALLKTPRSAPEWLQRAELLRLQRKGPQALEALSRARAAGADGLEPAIELLEGQLRLRMGEFAAAALLLEGRTEPEAVFWRLLARGMQVGLEPLRAEMLELARAFPDDRWTWRAAAMFCGQGMATGIDRATWHAEERLEGARVIELAPLSDAARAERDALDFLLRTQLPDGSWPVPIALSDPEGPAAVATAALAGSALIPHRRRAEVGAALERALEFVLAHPPREPSALLFDYGIWAQSFALRFLAECAKARVGEEARLLAALEELVAALARGRLHDGGWAYFRAAGSEGAAISFVSAATLCALLDARAAGVQVDQDLIDAAAELVAAARRAPGEYDYFGAQPAGPSAAAEAAFRGPLCALALLRAGRGGVEELRAALELYLAQRAHGLRERGKALCHTSPAGLASYYLIFGCAFAAEALEHLPRRERARFRAALLEDVLDLRTGDGAFCDNPAIGRHYGAALALRALRILRP